MDDFVRVDIPSWWDYVRDFAWSGVSAADSLFLMLSEIYR